MSFYYVNRCVSILFHKEIDPAQNTKKKCLFDTLKRKLNTVLAISESSVQIKTLRSTYQTTITNLTKKKKKI